MFNHLKKHVILISIFLLLTLTTIVFYPSLKNDFLNWDDPMNVTDNKSIKTLSWENIKQLFAWSLVNKDLTASYYHPLTMLSYALEYHFFKLNPFVFHLTNLIIHLLNVLLVFWLLLILTSDVRISFLTAIFFGIHPLQVESVAWVTERKNILSTFFFLLTIICHLLYHRNQNKKYYYLSLFIFILSLLSKPTAATVPLILILCDYLQKKSIRNSFSEKIPFFVIVFGFGIFNFFIQLPAKHIYTPPKFLDGICIAAHDVLFYIIKIMVPIKLSCFYPHPERINNLLPLPYLISPIILTSLVLLIFFSRKYTRKIIFAFSFFLITLSPVSVLIIQGYVKADRYNYVPLIGIFYLTGELFSWIYREKTKGSKALNIIITIILIGIISIFSFVTFQRCQVWKDSMTLWSDVIKKYPNVMVAYNDRGEVYLQRKEYDKAMEDFNMAIKIEPNFMAYTNRGKVYEETKEYDKAIADYNQAIKVEPSRMEAYINRGNTYYKIKEYDKAIDDYNQALILNSSSPKPYTCRGNVYFDKGDYDRALADYNKALTVEPASDEAYNNRGTFYGFMKEYDKAISDFTSALSINPNNIEAYYNRGITYSNMKEYKKALDDLMKIQSMGYQIDQNLLGEIRKASEKEE
jgi:protein O-mannosyl-transferase